MSIGSLKPIEIELEELTFVAVLAGCTSVASSFAALSSLSAAGSAARRVEARSTSKSVTAGAVWVVNVKRWARATRSPASVRALDGTTTRYRSSVRHRFVGTRLRRVRPWFQRRSKSWAGSTCRPASTDLGSMDASNGMVIAASVATAMPMLCGSNGSGASGATSGPAWAGAWWLRAMRMVNERAASETRVMARWRLSEWPSDSNWVAAVGRSHGPDRTQ